MIFIKTISISKMEQPSHTVSSMETEDFEGCNFDVEKGENIGSIRKCKPQCVCNISSILHRLCEVLGWLFCAGIIAVIFYSINGIFDSDEKGDEKHINYNYIWRHPFSNPPSMSELHSKTYHHWSKHHRRKCSDYDYGCCAIYDGGRKFTLSLHKVIPYDRKHTNCPTYGDLIYNYNIWRENYRSENNGTNCDIQRCCHLNIHEDELKNGHNPQKNISDYDITIKVPISEYGECPTIRDIWWQYDIDQYADPDEWPWFLIIIGLIGCGFGIHSAANQ